MEDEVDFLSADKHESSLQVCIAWHAQSTQNSKFTKSLEYLRENIKMKLIFCLLINVKGFSKVKLSFKVCVARKAQITQNNKFAISSQYLKREVIVMMLIFGMQIIMKSCHKLIPGIWSGWSSIPKVPKIASSQCPYKFSKKKLDLKLIFCMQVNIKAS